MWHFKRVFLYELWNWGGCCSNFQLPWGLKIILLVADALLARLSLSTHFWSLVVTNHDISRLYIISNSLHDSTFVSILDCLLLYAFYLFFIFFKFNWFVLEIILLSRFFLFNFLNNSFFIFYLFDDNIKK